MALIEMETIEDAIAALVVIKTIQLQFSFLFIFYLEHT